jgi:hypothetical protein
MDAIYQKEAEAWFLARGIEIKDLCFPPVGFIYPGVAAGWLGQTDFDVCFVDCLISNPEAPKELRAEALDQVILALVQKGKDLRYHTVAGLTKVPAVMERALGLGMIHLGNYALYQSEK